MYEMNVLDQLLAIFGYLTIFGILCLLISSSIVITKQKTVKIIEVFGKYSKTCQPGLSFTWPSPIALTAGVVPLYLREFQVVVDVRSVQKGFAKLPVSVQYRAIPDQEKNAFYELDNHQGQMKDWVLNSVRSTANEMSIDELYGSKDDIEKSVMEDLNKDFLQYGYKIEKVLVQDPKLSEDLERAYDQVVVAERDKEAATNQAEALRIKMVGEALAEAQSLAIKGDAFKVLRAKVAEGNKDAIEVMRGNKDVHFEEKTKVVGEKEEVYIDITFTDKENKTNSELTEKDLLDFIAGVDLREAMRDLGKSAGNVVVVPADYQQNFNNVPVSAKLADFFNNQKIETTNESI